MRSFLLKEMMLISYREKKARRVVFDPGVTIIRGENETGKSSLIKSIFITFGAEPAKVHPNWISSNVSSFLRFEVEGRSYSILRQRDSYAVFDSADKLIGKFQSVTSGLGPFLAGILNFGLRLSSREGEMVLLPPAYYFLPFYMDQDASWVNAWSAFAKLSQFPNWRRAVIEYHAGIRANEYYEAQAQKLRAEDELHKVRRRRESLQEIYRKLSGRFEGARFNVNFDEFKLEIEELLSKCNALREREEEYKNAITPLWSQLQSLKMQLAITLHARDEARRDHVYASDVVRSDVECPTCGAQYSNSFAERFAIAIDEEGCASLALKLSNEVDDTNRRLADKVEAALKIRDDLAAIELVLARREGEVALGDLIKQEGRRELQEVMKSDLVVLQEQEGHESLNIHLAEKSIRELDSPVRRKEINGYYQEQMENLLSSIDVQGVPYDKSLKVDTVIRDTGSELPRALLAAQLAFHRVLDKFGTAAVAPLVIDSPNQQDQDRGHLNRILEFLQRNRPLNRQIIIAMVDTTGVQFGGTEIVLTAKRSLLSRDEYLAVSDQIKYYVDAALEEEKGQGRLF